MCLIYLEVYDIVKQRANSNDKKVFGYIKIFFPLSAYKERFRFIAC